MKIVIDAPIMMRLLAYTAATQLEWSGLGFCERKDGNIVVYDFVLMDVGSPGYTEIAPERLLPLLDRPDRDKLKVWIHRHPIGNGIPGQWNWSGTDERTCKHEPLGSTPQAVNWSVSIVFTPLGPVGRIDNYVKNITQHLEVEPKVGDFFIQLRDFADSLWQARSSAKRKKSSTDFPAQETRRKKKKLIGKITPKNSKRMSSIRARSIPSMKSFKSFAGSTIRLARH